MPDLETLSERVSTLERTVTDGEMPELQDDVELRRMTTELTARLDELEAKQDELEAAILALRGYVGDVRAVNADVERRADAALATAEDCQDRLETHESCNSRPSHTDFNRTPPEQGSDTDPQSRSEIPPLESTRPDDHAESNERSLMTRLRELL
ncbi:DUF7310 family coiled-coil domain-containing protein [Haladaptatus sp.]|uniref:DUF7310 family coiled-coil domain-containing protein n=1 Tax=Haladaptatus sp. TaxID=1973141 RepID=UPI003C5CFBCC